MYSHPTPSTAAWLSSIESAKVDPRELQASVDAFMTELDTREERVRFGRTSTATASKRTRRRWPPVSQDGAAVGALTKRMDADGFTLVTRKKGGAAAASAALPGLAPPDESDNAKSKRKRGSLQKTDFYAWQGRDAKLDREWLSQPGGGRAPATPSRNAGLAELRRRFEEDKERIRRMQQARRGAEFA